MGRLCGVAGTAGEEVGVKYLRLRAREFHSPVLCCSSA